VPFILFFRLQEAILLIPRGITVLMDMLMDREVSTFSAYFLTLLGRTYATHDILIILCFYLLFALVCVRTVECLWEAYMLIYMNIAFSD